MKHRPHLSTNSRDMLLGLIGAALVMLIAGIGQALAPPTADARSESARLARCSQARDHVVQNKCVIRVLWAPYQQVAKAMSVAECESSFDHNARGPRDEYGNPRRGLWQFGTRERRVFGYGRTAVAQTRGAIAYWKYERHAGRSGWGPYECT